MINTVEQSKWSHHRLDGTHENNMHLIQCASRKWANKMN